jgi:predicted dehydrogenase
MIKIGIIGMSPGNAHPYSWSSIINGQFDERIINEIGFPAVSDYLRANQDTLGIPSAKVTHVWSQDRNISESIAKATGIDHIMEEMTDMIGQVDAVILSRDDPENHFQMAWPFIEAGVPIFIDKPLTIDREELARFAEASETGNLIMSCSSMRYAHECRTAKTSLARLGRIELITAVGKKDWVKYGVHLLEAIFAVLDDPIPESVQYVGGGGKDIVVLTFTDGLKVTLHLSMDISSTFQFSLFGSNDWQLVDIRNSYSMFKENIVEFIRSVEEKKSRLPFEKTYTIMDTLIAGIESKQRNGILIKLQNGR